MDPTKSTAGTIFGNIRHKWDMAGEGIDAATKKWDMYMNAFWNVEEGILNVPNALNNPQTVQGIQK
jgi:hypothetical protein